MSTKPDPEDDAKWNYTHREPTDAAKTILEASEEKEGILALIALSIFYVGFLASILWYHSDTGYQFENFTGGRMWLALAIFFLGPGLFFINILWEKHDYKSAALKDEERLTGLLGGDAEIALFFRSFGDLEARVYLHSALGAKLETWQRSLVVEAAHSVSYDGYVPVMLGQREYLSKHEAAFPGLSLWTTDEHWETVAWALLRAAKLIVVFPEATEGVITELQRLSANPSLLEKCVIVSPCDHFIHLDPPPFEPLQAWKNIAKALKPHGINLPEPRQTGFSYLPNPDLSVKQSRDFERSSYGELYSDGIRELVAGFSDVPEAEKAEAIAELEALINKKAAGIWSREEIEAFFDA